MRSRSGPSASVSRWAMPDDGSSKSSTSGSWARTQARSTMRREPVDSSLTNLSAKAPRPISSTSSSTLAATLRSLSPMTGKLSAAASGSRTSRCRSSARAMLSVTDMAGNIRASWKERPMPNRARASGDVDVMSSPSSRIEPVPVVR